MTRRIKIQTLCLAGSGSGFCSFPPRGLSIPQVTLRSIDPGPGFANRIAWLLIGHWTGLVHTECNYLGAIISVDHTLLDCPRFFFPFFFPDFTFAPVTIRTGSDIRGALRATLCLFVFCLPGSDMYLHFHEPLKPPLAFHLSGKLHLLETLGSHQ